MRLSKIKKLVALFCLAIFPVFVMNSVSAKNITVKFKFPSDDKAYLFLEDGSKKNCLWTSCRYPCIANSNLSVLRRLNGKKINECNPFYEKILTECLSLKHWQEDYESKMSDEQLDKFYDCSKEKSDKDNEFIQSLKEAFCL